MGRTYTHTYMYDIEYINIIYTAITILDIILDMITVHTKAYTIYLALYLKLYGTFLDRI